MANFIVYKDAEIKKLILDGELELLSGSKSIFAPLYKAIAELKPGHHLYVSNADFKALGGKSKPMHIAAYINQALNNVTGRNLGAHNKSAIAKLKGYEVRCSRYTNGVSFYLLKED